MLKKNESYDLLVRAVETIEDYAIFTLDPKGFVQSWNHGARRIKGYFPAEILGKHFSIFFPTEDQVKLLPKRKLEIAAERGRFEEEGWRVRKNGDRFWANIVITAMKNTEGKIIAFSKVTRDLTDQKEAEFRLKKSLEHTEDLEGSLRMRDEFISVASHELRTPVTRILLNIQLMKRNGLQLTEREKKSLDVCESATKELVGLMDNLVDVTRLRLGQLEVRRTKTNITRILLNVIGKFKDDIRFAGNLVSFNHEGDLVGYWDQGRLEQLFSNLLSNAIKYSEGTPIKMELRSDGERVFFSISDEGPGIPYHLQLKVFERFERAADPRKVSGLGLGLYVSKQIVEAHNGEIILESKPGQGAIFRLSLPLKKTTEKASSQLLKQTRTDVSLV